MNIKRTWIVASATIAVAGFAGAGVAMANDDVDLRDQQPAPVMQLKGDTGDDDARKATGSDSGASARSADSASDSPGEPGYKAPAPAPPNAADSGNSPTPPPVAPVADSGNSPAPPPVADSVDSPAPAKTYRPAPVHSGDSGGSGGSADSGD